LQVVARIQGHPSRRHLHAPLAESLGLPVEIVEHASEPPSPWAGYKECLRDIPDCSHLLVIQDDALVCRNFAAGIEQIAAAHPDTPVCLFLAPQPRRTSRDALRAMKEKRRYVTVFIRDFCPVVAMLWPRGKALEFREWAKDASLPGQPNPRSDDAVVGRWMISTRQRILATVPSLVQHRADVPAVKGVENASSRFSALFFCADALEYEW